MEKTGSGRLRPSPDVEGAWLRALTEEQIGGKIFRQIGAEVVGHLCQSRILTDALCYVDDWRRTKQEESAKILRGGSGR